MDKTCEKCGSTKVNEVIMKIDTMTEDGEYNDDDWTQTIAYICHRGHLVDFVEGWQDEIVKMAEIYTGLRDPE